MISRIVLSLAAVFSLMPAAFAQQPVAFQYACPQQTLTLPTCTTSFELDPHRRLVIQSISGSATPLNPTATGTFPTGQASLSIATTIANEATIPNIIGPNYALTGSNTWFFTNFLILYSDKVPVVMNNGGPVYIQGYLLYR